MHILKYRNIYFGIAGAILLLAVCSIGYFGLRPGIDLVGGSLLEVTYETDRPALATVDANVAALGFGDVRVQPTEQQGFIVRSRDMNIEEKQALLSALTIDGAIPKEERFTSIGPTIGTEIKNKGLVSLVLVSLMVILYVAFVFRHVSEPVSSWKYGCIAVLTLIHDIIIPTGLFAFLGYVNGAEVDSLFIVALLTILGISINDTIVTFDRVRENLKKNQERRTQETFETTVGKSMDQTTARSFNTSFAVILSLVALLIFGPETTRNFALMLTVGMIAGTYSSIFLAAPLLVILDRWQKAPAK